MDLNMFLLIIMCLFAFVFGLDIFKFFLKPLFNVKVNWPRGGCDHEHVSKGVCLYCGKEGVE